jgi:hypothetical protein
LSGTLGRVLGEIEDALPEEGHLIWKVWASAVGPELARRCRPVEFRRGKLTVSVAGASWVQQLTLLAPRVIAVLNEAAGKELVETVRFRQESEFPRPAGPEPFPTAWKEEPLSEEKMEAIASELDGLADRELRAAILGARTMAEKRARFRAARGGNAPPPSTSPRRRRVREESGGD